MTDLRQAVTLPRLTIITSTYNCPEALTKTAASIREQSYKNIQWIVVDGASTDGTVNVITASLDIVTDWLSEPDSGIYDAWNKACRLIDGDWVLFLGAGDLIHNQTSLTEFWENAPINCEQFSILYGNVLMTKVDGTPRYLCRKTNLDYWEFARPALPSHQSVFHSKKLFSSQAPFDITYRISADSKFLLQALKIGAGLHIDITIAKMPDDGISNNANNYLIAQNEIKRLCVEIGIHVPLIYKIRADAKRFVFFIANSIFQNRIKRQLQKISDKIRFPN
jgi:glycosyltransferase involved in cell wall biosynthesis